MIAASSASPPSTLAPTPAVSPTARRRVTWWSRPQAWRSSAPWAWSWPAGSRRPAPPRRARGEFVVSFLSVGQGDATLLQLDGATALVDTGPPGGPILRRLEEAGVDRLDLLVLTHAEADHEGMALPVLSRFRPRLVLNGGAGWPTRVQAALGGALQAVGARELPRGPDRR